MRNKTYAITTLGTSWFFFGGGGVVAVVMTSRGPLFYNPQALIQYSPPWVRTKIHIFPEAPESMPPVDVCGEGSIFISTASINTMNQKLTIHPILIG